MFHRLLTLIIKEMQALLRDPQTRAILIMPEITNTSASWAMIRPKKVIWLEKMKLRIAGVLAAYQETNAVSSRPQVIQP